jgi:hypothetical protein
MNRIKCRGAFSESITQLFRRRFSLFARRAAQCIRQCFGRFLHVDQSVAEFYFFRVGGDSRLARRALLGSYIEVHGRPRPHIHRCHHSDSTMKYTDPIIEEIRAVRDMAKECDYDIKKLAARIKSHEVGATESGTSEVATSTAARQPMRHSLNCPYRVFTRYCKRSRFARSVSVGAERSSPVRRHSRSSSSRRLLVPPRANLLPDSFFQTPPAALDNMPPLQ